MMRHREDESKNLAARFRLEPPCGLEFLGIIVRRSNAMVTAGRN